MPIGRMLLVALLVSAACANQPADPASGESAQPVSETVSPAAPADATQPRVTLPDGFVVVTELAIDDDSRAQGLMYRDQLRPGMGMLFFFPVPGEYPFWMRNTLIPLDIIWLDESRKIAAIHHDVPPCRTAECPSYPPRAVAKYVLEVGAGEAKKHGLKVGDALLFANMENVTAR